MFVMVPGARCLVSRLIAAGRIGALGTDVDTLTVESVRHELLYDLSGSLLVFEHSDDSFSRVGIHFHPRQIGARRRGYDFCAHGYLGRDMRCTKSGD